MKDRQISLSITGGSFDEGCSISAIRTYDHLISDVVSQNIVILGELVDSGNVEIEKVC